MDALMPIDEQVLAHIGKLAEQLTAMRQDFNREIRELVEALNKHAVSYEQRLTTVERDLVGHIKLDEQKHKRIDEKIDEHEGRLEGLAKQTARDFTGLRKRIDKVWKIGTGIAAAIGAIIGFLRYYKG